jgi:hypothetical protein
MSSKASVLSGWGEGERGGLAGGSNFGGSGAFGGGGGGAGLGAGWGGLDGSTLGGGGGGAGLGVVHGVNFCDTLSRIISLYSFQDNTEYQRVNILTQLLGRFI